MQTAKQCLVFLEETLQNKEKIYENICQWFEVEYDSSTSKEKVSEMEKRGVEFDSQIKLLRFLISEIKS